VELILVTPPQNPDSGIPNPVDGSGANPNEPGSGAVPGDNPGGPGDGQNG
jgi:hypothetical protein